MLNAMINRSIGSGEVFKSFKQPITEKQFKEALEEEAEGDCYTYNIIPRGYRTQKDINYKSYVKNIISPSILPFLHFLHCFCT